MLDAFVLNSCSWDNPGVNPYRGSLMVAIDNYKDIEPSVREKLKERVSARKYDEIVDISRDEIRGKANYNNTIYDMHFGKKAMCKTVIRSSWPDTKLERGLVYCESGQCIMIPTVCNNVSRIQKLATRSEPVASVAKISMVPLAGLPGVAEAPLLSLGEIPKIPGPSFGMSNVAPPIIQPFIPPLPPAPPIPEPSTWLMMLAGILGIAYLKTK